MLIVEKKYLKTSMSLFKKVFTVLSDNIVQTLSGHETLHIRVGVESIDRFELSSHYISY